MSAMIGSKGDIMQVCNQQTQHHSFSGRGVVAGQIVQDGTRDAGLPNLEDSRDDLVVILVCWQRKRPDEAKTRFLRPNF